MELRAMRGTESLYAYQQSQQISMQTGLVGYVRGDFGQSGQEWWPPWFGFREDWNTPEFKEDLQKVMDGLRFDTKELSDRSHLAALCRQHPESSISEDGRWFGFRVDSEKYAFLMKCSPHKGDYNLYVYGYHKDWLDQHMARAEHGIRFITPEYKELFRIPDGGSVRITRTDGSHIDRVCRYIDDTHMEIGSGWDSVWHICQFAEQMERNGDTVTPIGPTLGEQKPKSAPGMTMEQTMG